MKEGWRRRGAFWLGLAALGGAWFAEADWVGRGAALLGVVAVWGAAPGALAGSRRALFLAACAALALVCGVRAARAYTAESRLRNGTTFLAEGVVLEEAENGSFRAQLYEADGVPLRWDVRLRGVEASALPGDRFRGRLRFAGGVFEATAPLAWLRSTYSLRRFAGTVRRVLRARIEAAYPRAGGFVEAVLLGAREEVPPAVVDALRGAGALHLLAVSGLHVGFLAGLGWVLLRPLPRAGRCVVLIAALAVYALAAGERPSVLRASWMAAAFLAAGVAGRPGDLANAWGLAALAGLWFDPAALTRPGFVLSYGAVFALIHWGEFLSGSFASRSAVVRAFCAPLVTALVVESFTAPVAARWFFGGALYAPLANALLIPTMALWYPFAWLGAVLPPLGGVVEPVILAWLGAARWLGELPGGYVPWGGFPAEVVPWYVAGWLAAPRPEVPRAVKTALAAGLLLTAALARPAPRPEGAARITLPAPDGPAAVLERSDGTTWLIGAGPSDLAARRALATAGIRRIDGLLLPGGARRVAGGAAEAVRTGRPTRFLIPAGARDAPRVAEAVTAAARGGAGVAAISGDVVRAGEGIVLFAEPDAWNLSARFQERGGSVFFASPPWGDRPDSTEASVLLLDARFSEAQSEAVFRAVRPRLVVVRGKISDGRFEREGARVLRSDRSGSIRVILHADGRIEARYAPLPRAEPTG